MREALALLVSGGFVQLESNKGFRVAPVSRSRLIDVTQTRQIVEGEALKAAIAHGTKAWEEEIFTSFQLLKREIDYGIRTRMIGSTNTRSGTIASTGL